MAICPMCGLPEKFLKDDPDSDNKTFCTGCGTKFFDKFRTV